MILPNSKWPKYDSDLIVKVSKLIKKGSVNYLFGKTGLNFEKAFSKYHGLNYSVAVSNGTVGLELALLSLNLKKKDEIIVSPRSYYSSASCILRNGLEPVFADIDINTHNISPEEIRKKITTKTKCIICVHLGGVPCDMEEIMKIARKYNLKVIEDCSQAHGAKIGKKIVGSFGDISVWSFCNDKIISTLGEGGMISTNNKKIFEKLWSLKDIGKNYQKFNQPSNTFGFQWLHDYVGTNARLTEVQSLSGLYQLKKLNSYVVQRRKNANYIKIQLKDIPCFKFIEIPKNFYNSYYRFNFIFDPIYNSKKISRDIILKKLNNKIFIRQGSCPEIYKEKFFKKNYKFNCFYANYIGKNSLSLQVDHTIKKKDLVKTIQILKNFTIENL